MHFNLLKLHVLQDLSATQRLMYKDIGMITIHFNAEHVNPVPNLPMLLKLR